MIKVGDKIRVRGDRRDFTDHLDNEILVVVATYDNYDDVMYELDENTIIAKDEQGINWYIWTSNISCKPKCTC